MSEITTLVSSTNPKTTCQVETIGCGLGKVWLDGQQILWTGARPDGGRGFTHPCIPNFNLAQDLPNHGPARKAEWLKEGALTWSWRMSEIEGVYPEGLEATRTFELGERELTVTTIITNHSSVDLPINIAEHHYFLCDPDKRDQVKVDGKQFSLSGLRGEAEFNPWSQGDHLIEIPGVGTIKMTVGGYEAFAQWSQPEAHFVCVEPVQTLPPAPENFKTQAPKIGPGESKVFTYTLSLAEA